MSTKDDPLKPLLQILFPQAPRREKEIQHNRVGFRITVPTTGGGLDLLAGARDEDTILIGGHIGLFSGTARNFFLSVMNNQGVDFLLSGNNTNSKKLQGELVLLKDDVLRATFASGAADVALYQGWLSFRVETFK